MVRKDDGDLEMRPLSEINEVDIVVHDAHRVDPTYAFALSRLSTNEHVLVGVFRGVTRPSYGDLVHEQVESVIAKQGKGDLAALLAGGDSWEIS